MVSGQNGPSPPLLPLAFVDAATFAALHINDLFAREG
jgi:hypothetical protein